MQAQVRTIVAASGERLVVMPEAQYDALLSAARRPGAVEVGQGPAGAARKGEAATPAQLMAQMPVANPPCAAAKRTSRPAANGAPEATAAAPATSPSQKTRRSSLEDVLLFG